MKRRNFLQTLGAGAPATLAANAAPNPAGPSTGAEPKVFFYDDGRHASGLYQFAPPLAPGDLTFAVDQLVASGVDTLIYSAGLEGRRRAVRQPDRPKVGRQRRALGATRSSTAPAETSSSSLMTATIR